MANNLSHETSRSQQTNREMAQLERLVRQLETAKKDQNYSTRDIMILQADLLCLILSTMLLERVEREGALLAREGILLAIENASLRVELAIREVGEELGLTIVSEDMSPKPPSQVSIPVDTGGLERKMSRLLEHLGIPNSSE